MKKLKGRPLWTSHQLHTHPHPRSTRSRHPPTHRGDHARADSSPCPPRFAPGDDGVGDEHTKLPPSGNNSPYRRGSCSPAASLSCIFAARSFTPPRLELKRKPRLASSKQAMLGTMVSQLRKLRFPLTIRSTYMGKKAAECVASA